MISWRRNLFEVHAWLSSKVVFRITLIVAALLIGSCVPLSIAQGQRKTQQQIRPNLAGVWSVDQARETKNSFPEPSETTLIISQQEPEIRMRRKFTLGGAQQEQESVYYTDQRGEANVTLRGGKSKSESRTRWEDDRLVTRYESYSSQIAGSPIEAQNEVDWRILKGGEVLVKRITITHRAGTSVDSTISARDRRTPTIIPPTIILERFYRRVP
jgi:hypothetical protein